MLKKIQKLLRRIVLLFFGSTILFVIIYRWCPVYVTPLMFIRCVQQVCHGEKLRLRHHWVPLTDISHNFPQAVMAAEDNLFLRHNGFDFEQIYRARLDAMHGKGERGASTISQQTAKNVFLWPGHNWLRKGLEAYFTVLIEHIWGKRRIMEVYLNSIETGHGIYGVEAVAQMHFATHANAVSARQAALVAASLPAPLKRDSAHPSAYMVKRSKQITSLMRKIDTFPADDTAPAK